MPRIMITEGHNDMLAKASLEIIPGVLIAGIRICLDRYSPTPDIRLLWPTRTYQTATGQTQSFRIIRPSRFDDLKPIQLLEDEVLDAYDQWKRAQV